MFNVSRPLDTGDENDNVILPNAATYWGFIISNTNSSWQYPDDGTPDVPDYQQGNRTGYFETYLFTNGTTVYYNMHAAALKDVLVSTASLGLMAITVLY